MHVITASQWSWARELSKLLQFVAVCWSVLRSVLHSVLQCVSITASQWSWARELGKLLLFVAV